MTQTGTLKELNVKLGDVVKFVEGEVTGFTLGEEYECVKGKDGYGGNAIGPVNTYGGCIPVPYADLTFTIVSRATDTTDTLKTWGEMTDAEKGALLLANFEGKVIESNHDFGWNECQPEWVNDAEYRIKPEPVVEEVVMYGYVARSSFGVNTGPCDTHRITFTTTDGEPDLDSIKMEEV